MFTIRVILYGRPKENGKVSFRPVDGEERGFRSEMEHQFDGIWQCSERYFVGEVFIDGISVGIRENNSTITI